MLSSQKLLHAILLCGTLGLASLKEPTILKHIDYGFEDWNFSDVFTFEEDRGKLVVTTPYEGYYPCQLGKYLGWYANDTRLRLNGTLEEVRRINDTYEVEFNIPQDSQFIIFQLSLPFPAPMFENLTYYEDQVFGPNNYFKQVYVNEMGSLTLFQKVATESQNETLEEDLTLGRQEFGLSIYVFPEKVKEMFAVRITRAYFTVKYMDTLSDFHKEYLEMSIREYRTEPVNKDYIVFDPELNFKESKGRRIEEVDSYIPEVKFQEDIQLKYGDILFAHTDESFQLWLSKDQKSAYIIDCGSLFLSGGLKQLTKQAAQISDIHLTITHYHIEHMQTIASLIKNSPGVTIHIYVAEATALAFAGWYIQHITIMGPLVMDGKLKIYMADTDVYIKFGDYELMYLCASTYEPEFRHFIPNVTPLVKLDDNRVIMVGGDLEDYSDQKDSQRKSLELLIEDFLRVSFLKARITNEIERIDFFFYIGLLSKQVYLYPYIQDLNDKDHPVVMPEDLINHLETRFKDKNLHVTQAHIKDHGYGMALLETRADDQSNKKEEL